MATLWCMPEEADADPLMQAAHPPAPCRVIEITPQVRAKDEADRAQRERARRAAVSWRAPESAKEGAEAALTLDEKRLIVLRQVGKGHGTRTESERIATRLVKGLR